MGTVAHHRKLEEIYYLGTIQTQEQDHVAVHYVNVGSTPLPLCCL